MPEANPHTNASISLKQYISKLSEPMGQDEALFHFFEIAGEVMLAHERGESIGSIHPDCVWISHDEKPAFVRIDRLFANEFPSSPSGEFDAVPESNKETTPGVSQRSISMGSLFYDILSGQSHFVAPEIHDGAAFSEKTDIFALGALLYTLLASQMPTSQPLPSVAERTSERLTLQPFDDVITEACAISPKERFEDVEAMRQALRKAHLEVMLRQKAKDELKDQAKDAAKDALKEQLKQQAKDAAVQAGKEVAKAAGKQSAHAAGKLGIKAGAATTKSAVAIWGSITIGTIIMVGAGFVLYRIMTTPVGTPLQPNPARQRVQVIQPPRNPQPKTAPGQRTAQAACPAKHVRIQVRPTLAKNTDISLEKGKATRRKGSVCVPQDAGQVLIDQQGEVRCVFKLPKGKPTLTVWLQREGLTLLSPDYCLTKKK